MYPPPSPPPHPGVLMGSEPLVELSAGSLAGRGFGLHVLGGHMSFLPPRSRHQRESLWLVRPASFHSPVRLPCFLMLLLLQLLKSFSNNTKRMLSSRQTASQRRYYLFISAPFRAQCPALLGKINERKAISLYVPNVQLSGSPDLSYGAAPGRSPVSLLCLSVSSSCSLPGWTELVVLWARTTILIRWCECF